MNLATRLRSHSALWASPLALGLVLYYFFRFFQDDYEVIKGEITYAPEIVSLALDPTYALAYAAASCLAAWESGRLKRDGVWAGAPARSRYRIAAHALFPVLVLAWAMLVLPVLLALAREGVAPTWACVPLPAMTLLVATAHCAIGFGVGAVVPRLLAAPLLAAGVFYGVASSASSGERLWPRHVLGQYSRVLTFGEHTTWTSLAPHVLFAGGLAAGVALLWVPARNRHLRSAVPALACAVALAGTLTAYSIAKDWGASAPVSVGHADLDCSGSTPRVCVPAAGHADPSEARTDAEAVLSELAAAGVRVKPPRTVSDNIVNGVHPRSSTKGTWWLPVTSSQRKGTTRYEVVKQAVHFPCKRTTDIVASRSAMLWASGTVGEGKRYLKWQRGEMLQFANGDKVLGLVEKRVAEVRRTSRAAQASWFRGELRRACGDGARPAGDS
ncbi:hypothetical protein [Streptomyces boncukensis]|uniref:Uncharacterized protein n=1 Tax=Streptomyces boncukensis TaxID=2711219 RepID=A0A6G4X003_9ACTN|nr:hypothetical protein [Streptomyces boncukensis]NGO70879.1 hypothetical protein [Streptomyces boncukensis]